MSGRTGISWTDRTWNPVVGCTKVSQGCKHCYAKTLHDMRHRAFKAGKLQNIPQYAEPFETVQLLYRRLEDPLRWRKPSRVFVNSLSDLFHDDVDMDFIALVFATMACAQQHQFQILTKRPARMQALLRDEDFHDRVDAYADDNAIARTDPLNRRTDDLRAAVPEMWTRGLLPNVWLGVSVENQAAADERIPLLLETPAAVRFLSCEPLLGAVDLTRLRGDGNGTWRDALGGRVHRGPAVHTDEHVDWVIVGGESGKGARPMHPDWAHSLLDQCQAAGVPLHFKQWGDWVSSAARAFGTVKPKEIIAIDCEGKRLDPPPVDENADAITVARVGTKRAGRDLAGQTWDQWPEVRS